jgi:hypothetical protein
MRLLAGAAALLCAARAQNCSAPPPAGTFNLTAMDGAWYEIARVQTAGGNALQQFCACTQLVFSPNPDNSTYGNKDVLNSCRFETPAGFYLNATSYLTNMGPPGHWDEVYFPGG